MNQDASDTILLTPTWAGDLEHFRLLRASIRCSPLAMLKHHIVVQTEDWGLFEPFAREPNVILRTTAEILPKQVEDRRRRARVIASRAGRHLTRSCGSLRRSLGWPLWPAYTGWHTQQLCKIAVASEAAHTTSIVLDSDVLVTGAAQLQDFKAQDAVVCFTQWQTLQSLSGKVRNWVYNAALLTGAAPLTDTQPINAYFDTPFVFDGEALRAMLDYFERQSGLPWWQHLLNQPPRRWSEFGLYKQFLNQWEQRPIDWRSTDLMHYIYDTRDADAVVQQVINLFDSPDVHYITIHSQSSGKHNWNPQGFSGRLLEWIGTR